MQTAPHGQFCVNFAGILSPAGYTSVDAPSNDCGEQGADCAGIRTSDQ